MPEVSIEESRRFVEDSLVAVGTPVSEAKAHADLLLQADLSGHFSHGINRLELYVNDIVRGACDPKAKPVVLKESAATAWVDGVHALGSTVGNFCMDLAIRKAKESGVGWVSAQRCNHYGMAGYWAMKAEKEGLIGMSFTNSSPVMVPTRAKEGCMGTNPIGMCAPANGEPPLMVDMATTAVALGKIEVKKHKGEPIPLGWALGPDGQPTTDTDLAFTTGRMLPLGGLEDTSGYKGYCLSAMVEIFCSGLSGSLSTYQIRPWSLDNSPDHQNLGQCFAAIDPNCFAPGFGQRVANCLRAWRSMEPVDPNVPVLVPGDKERINIENTMKLGVVEYAHRQIDTLNKVAKKLNIKPIVVKN